MNTKEASKKWGCSESTVREYCKNGLIPLAEKKGFNWDIPDEMRSLPPVTLHKAVFLMKCIEDNVLPETSRYWNEEKMVDALEYLSDMRFIVNYDGHISLEQAAKKSKVSKLGKELIKKADRKPGKNEFGIEGEAGLSGEGPKASVKVSAKHTE